MNDILTPTQLAARWGMSIGTLQNWRVQKRGPAYIKLGSGRAAKVVYRVADIEAFENQNQRGDA